MSVVTAALDGDAGAPRTVVTGLRDPRERLTTWHCLNRACGERHDVAGAGVDPQAPVRARAAMQDHANNTHAGETRWPCTFVLTHPSGTASVTYATPTQAQQLGGTNGVLIAPTQVGG